MPSRYMLRDVAADSPDSELRETRLVVGAHAGQVDLGLLGLAAPEPANRTMAMSAAAMEAIHRFVEAMSWPSTPNTLYT